MGNRILSLFGTIAQAVFWGIGYYIGFTVVGILSFGTICSAPFTDIGKWADHKLWRIGYRRNGRYYVIAELVALVGWLALSVVIGSLAGCWQRGL